MEKRYIFNGLSRNGGNNIDIEYRSVIPDSHNAQSKKDYSYCYNLAVDVAWDDTVTLAWEWLEKQQHKSFSVNFFDLSTYIMYHDNKRIGCFRIDSKNEDVFLCKVHIEKEYQGRGIGSAIIEKALVIAHEARKPLKLAVLISNKGGVEFFGNRGFEKTEHSSMDGDASWIQMNIMTHEDTFKYSNKTVFSHSINNLV